LDGDLTRECPSFLGIREDAARLWTLEHAVEPLTPASTPKLSHDADNRIDTSFPSKPSQSTTDDGQLIYTFGTSEFSWPAEPESQASLSSNPSALLDRTIPESGCPSDDLSRPSGDWNRDSMLSSSETPESMTMGNRRLGMRKNKKSPQPAKSEDTIVCAIDSPAWGSKDRKAHVQGCHKQAEKKYRNRINKDFQLLFNALTECVDDNDLVSTVLTGSAARNRSKGSILKLARHRLLALQTENRWIASEMKTMRRNWMESHMGHIFKPRCETYMAI
jgi:hypothetical protein